MTKDEEALALRVAKEQYYEDSVKWPEEYTQRVIDYAARFLAEIRKTQTPVAWIAEFPDGGKLLWDDSFKLAYRGGSKSVAYQPLYTTPTIPPHLALVPREPTEEMLHLITPASASYNEWRANYKSMLAAGEVK